MLPSLVHVGSFLLKIALNGAYWGHTPVDTFIVGDDVPPTNIHPEVGIFAVVVLCKFPPNRV